MFAHLYHIYDDSFNGFEIKSEKQWRKPWQTDNAIAKKMWNYHNYLFP